MIKTHIDILSDFSPETTSGLKAIAEKHNFLIFEDRKFIDIGNTVQKQYHGGALRISEWSHIINCAILPGEGIVQATGAYTTRSVDYARRYKEFVMGFVCNRSLTEEQSTETTAADDEDFVVFTTGVNLASAGDALGQQYQTPQSAVGRGADFIIAGRGIYAAPDPVEAVKQYREQGWKAYLERVGLSE